jgi:chromosome partitioning protein
LTCNDLEYGVFFSTKAQFRTGGNSMSCSDSGEADGTMSTTTRADGLHKIVVLNPKGGSGKTTLATNLASFYALRGSPPTLVDCDPQGFCLRWLEKRPADRPVIHGLEGYSEGLYASALLTMKGHPDSSVMIIDLPAAIPYDRLHAFTYVADSILLPIQPSAIDVHAGTRFIAELLLDAQLDRNERRLAIVANRVRERTRSFSMLMRFLSCLSIPMIAAVRDSQNFVHAADAGLGVREMPSHRVKNDLAPLNAIVNWLDTRRLAMIARAASRDAQNPGLRDGGPVADWHEAGSDVDVVTDNEAG